MGFNYLKAFLVPFAVSETFLNELKFYFTGHGIKKRILKVFDFLKKKSNTVEGSKTVE